MARTISLDLHTHSILSHDGGVTEADYTTILNHGILDCVAVTDHNQILFAQRLHTRFKNRIIVGEEISTAEGHLIGLFLTRAIAPGLSAEKTAYHIKEQNGLVY